MPTILHLIPGRSFAATFTGTHKDILSRIEWFRDHGYCHHKIFFEDDCLSHASKVAISQAADPVFIVEYSLYPMIVKEIKYLFPNSVVIIRSHNIEPLQHLANYGFRPKGRSLLWVLWGSVRLLWQDIMIKATAEYIASINENELKWYWNRLPGKAKPFWLPYIPPNHFKLDIAKTTIPRNIIACMPLGSAPRDIDLVRRFVKYAAVSHALGYKYRFVITGNCNFDDVGNESLVERIGFIDDIGKFLYTCKALCILTPMGYGFKTTMGDAFAAGVHVVAHPRIIEKAPKIYQKKLVSSDNVRKSLSLINSDLDFNDEQAFLLNLRDSQLEAVCMVASSRSNPT
jgi:hypothetical protein